MPTPTALMAGSRIPKSDPLEGHLQDMLRYNMEKYAGQALDTLAAARRVRELLSVHNIGQRLFAKYVLGLSQGTVSELLSKPKSWEKLTEKGRDSYRKMHAWAYDEGAIMMLKSLIPRKGELSRPQSRPHPVMLGLPQSLTGTEFPPGENEGSGRRTGGGGHQGPGDAPGPIGLSFVPRHPFPGPMGPDTMPPKMPFALMTQLQDKVRLRA